MLYDKVPLFVRYYKISLKNYFDSLKHLQNVLITTKFTQSVCSFVIKAIRVILRHLGHLYPLNSICSHQTKQEWTII